MSALGEAIRIAERAEAGYQLRRVLGIPAPWAHRRADYWLGRAQAAEDKLVPDMVLRWGRR